MQLREIMTRHVFTCAGADSIAAAAAKMREAKVGCLVVINAGGQRGIITDRDLAVQCVASGHQVQQCRVAVHMSSPLITATPSMDVLEAAHIMVEKKVKRLPIVDGEQLVGLVSFSDIARALDLPMRDILLGVGAVRRAA